MRDFPNSAPIVCNQRINSCQFHRFNSPELQVKLLQGIPGCQRAKQ
jgi:hypothetical protein